MKSECNLNSNKGISESRKIRKPLMEKKRRARINDSLETLKQILLESQTALKENSNGKKSGQRTAKLEKADILEMTVRYVQQLHNKLNQMSEVRSQLKEDIIVKNTTEKSEGIQVGVTLIPTKLSNGNIVFVMPTNVNQKKICREIPESVWRPW